MSGQRGNLTAHHQQLAGSPAERQLAEAEQRHEHDRAHARQRDNDQLRATEQRAEDLAQRTRAAARDLADLRMEHDIRQRLTPDVADREAAERAANPSAHRTPEQPSALRQQSNLELARNDPRAIEQPTTPEHEVGEINR